MGGVDGLADEIMAWDLSSKYVVGEDDPCYCLGPASHYGLGKR